MRKSFKGFVGLPGPGPKYIYNNSRLDVNLTSPIQRLKNDEHTYVQEFTATISLDVQTYKYSSSDLAKLFPRPPKPKKGEDRVVLVKVDGSIFDHRTKTHLMSIYDEDTDAARDVMSHLMDEKVDGKWLLPKNLHSPSGEYNSSADFRRHIWLWEMKVTPKFDGLRLEPFAVAAILDHLAALGDMLTVSIWPRELPLFRKGLPDLLLVPRPKDKGIFETWRLLFHAIDHRMFLPEA